MTKKLTDVASRLTRPKPTRDVIYIVDFENVPTLDVAALLRRKRVTMVVLAANRTNTVTPETLATIEKNPERVEVIIGRVTRKEFVDKLVIAKVGEYAFRFPDAEIVVVANDRDYADLADHLNDHWEREVAIRHEAPGKRRTRRKKAAGSRAADEPAAGEGATRKKATRKRAGGGAEPAKKKATRKRGGDAAAPAKEAAGRRGGRKPGATTLDNPDAEAVRALLAKLPVRRRPKSRDALLNAIRNYRESVGLRSRPSTILRQLQERGVVDATRSPVSYTL